MRAKRLLVLGSLAVFVFAQAAGAPGSRRIRFAIRGVDQTLYLFTPEHRRPDPPVVIVVSGDGGWHGFIIEVAQYLAVEGYPAVGVDAKEYLATMSKPKALEPGQISGDFSALVRFAREQTGAGSAVLVGWSEGAGLAVLGGLGAAARGDLRGVVAIGLPELNELAWRWSDAAIYLTHKVPNEPTFNSKDYVGKLSPLPLMVIQSTEDPFVPPDVARDIFARAREPKRMAIIEARGHHFEGQRPAFWQALDRALRWFESLASQSPH